MAHIRRHPVDNTKWQVRYIDPTGRERSRTFPRKVDAEKFLIHVEAQKQRSEWINPELSSTRFEEWSMGWLANRAHLKPKTFAGYESLLKVHILPRFGSSRLDRIDSLSIEEWIADLKDSGLSASRIRQAHNVLSQILKTAVRARYLPANSAEGVALPRKPRREQLFLNPPEVGRLAGVVDERYRALVYVFAYGALRWGEAAALRRQRVDVLRGKLVVAESLSEVGGDLHFGPTKNYRNRVVTLPKFLREMLNDQLITYTKQDPEALVFTVSNGAPMRNSNFSSNVWKPAVDAAGLPAELRVHDLRHTAVAILISQGVHPEAIKRFLGHSSIMVTMDIYGHLFPSEQEKLAAALDDAFAQSQTDKRRTKTGKRQSFVDTDHQKGQATLDLSEVGPVGLEPTTNGLKARCSAS
jgi:integrase